MGLLLLLVAISFAKSSLASATVNREWLRYYNGSVNREDRAEAMTVDGSGNVYVTGLSDDANPLYTSVTVSYAPDGTQRWVRRHEGYTSDIAVDALGNVYITGSSSDDYLTISYASDGTLRWTRYYQGIGGGGVARALAVDGNGNIYVTGYSHNGQIWDTATVSYSSEGTQRWVQRYDAASNVPSSTGNVPGGITVGSDGNVYVAGNSYGDTDYDYFTASYTSGGTPRWVQRYNGAANGQDLCRAVATDGAGNVYVTGLEDVGNYSGYRATTVSYTSEGATRWVRSYNRAGNNNQPAAIVVDSNRNVYVVGYSRSTTGDFLAISYGPDGTERWVQHYNGVNGSGAAAADAAVDNQGNVYVVGQAVDGSRSYFATVSYTSSGVQRWVQLEAGALNYTNRATSVVVNHAGEILVTGLIYNLNTATDFATVKYNQRELDLTAPTCIMAGTASGPSRVFFDVQDVGSGLATVVPTIHQNCTVTYSFTPGTTSVVRVTATKIDGSRSARVELQVTDQAGNVIVCDPVIANIEVPRGSGQITRTFKGIPDFEHFLTVTNGSPGVSRLAATINGRSAVLLRLGDGETSTGSFPELMRSGAKNVVRLTAFGRPGSHALVIIGDSSTTRNSQSAPLQLAGGGSLEWGR